MFNIFNSTLPSKNKIGLFILFIVLFALQFSGVYPFYADSFKDPFMAGWLTEYILFFTIIIILFSYIFWSRKKIVFKKTDWIQSVVLSFFISYFLLQIKYNIDDLIFYHEQLNRDLFWWKFLFSRYAVFGFSYSLFLLLTLLGMFIPHKIGYTLSMLFPLFYISVICSFFSVSSIWTTQVWQIFLMVVFIYPFFIHQKKILSYWKIMNKKSCIIQLSISLLIVIAYWLVRYLCKY